MPTVTRHVAGSRFKSGSDSEYSEKVLVTELTTSSVLAMINEALGWAPALGSSLGSPFATMTCHERFVEKVDCDTGSNDRWAEVTVLWRVPNFSATPDDDGPGVTTTSTTLETLETYKDRDGNLMVVQHNGQDQPVQLTTRVQKAVFRFQRSENTNPRFRASTYSGKVNSLTWNGYPPGSVLCSGIDSTTSDGGDTYDVTYTFEYDEDLHVQTGAWKDPDTQEVPSDVVDGTGIKDFNLQKEISFAGLNITL